jgi:transposase InsO family protein
MLDANWLMSQRYVQHVPDEWREDYNNYHPHCPLVYKSHLVYRKSFL